MQSAYDTAGRPFKFSSYASATSSTPVNEVQRDFNGFGQMTAQYQAHSGAVDTATTPKVQYAYVEGSGANNSRLTSMTYPNGRILRYECSSGADTISRLSLLAASSC